LIGLRERVIPLHIFQVILMRIAKDVPGGKYADGR